MVMAIMFTVTVVAWWFYDCFTAFNIKTRTFSMVPILRTS